MKVIISPAKSLDFDASLPTEDYSMPLFLDKASNINEVLRKKTPNQLSKLMGISNNLAELNWERNQAFEKQFTPQNARPAIFTFSGEVYQGLDAFHLNKNELDYLQKNTYILSGQYGILRPLDLMQAYRLEMGTTLRIGSSKNLYDYWKKNLTAFLETQFSNEDILVNLASNEYSKAIDLKKVSATVYSPIFKDWKNDQLKVISFFAKKARGMMLRYMAQNSISTASDLLGFNAEGYHYSAEHTKNEFEPVFVR